MTQFGKMLPVGLAALLLLSACELIDAVEVAVSGPHCGSFDIPPELENKDLNVIDHRFDWDRIDELITLLESYEDDHNPHILFALGVLYIKKAVTLSDDPAYFRRGVRLFHWAALCGQMAAVEMLSGLYSEGDFGVEKNPEFDACLNRSYDPHKNERALIPGRLWSCGLRVKDLPE